MSRARTRGSRARCTAAGRYTPQIMQAAPCTPRPHAIEQFGCVDHSPSFQSKGLYLGLKRRISRVSGNNSLQNAGYKMHGRTA